MALNLDESRCFPFDKELNRDEILFAVQFNFSCVGACESHDIQ